MLDIDVEIVPNYSQINLNNSDNFIGAEEFGVETASWETKTDIAFFAYLESGGAMG